MPIRRCLEKGKLNGRNSLKILRFRKRSFQIKHKDFHIGKITSRDRGFSLAFSNGASDFVGLQTNLF